MDNINVGTSPNSGTGDKLRDAFIKVVNNFNELSNKYDTLDQKVNDIDVPTKTSTLLNDGSDGINPFITLEDVPAGGVGTLDEVLQKGNSSDREITLGNIRLNTNELLYDIIINNANNTSYVHRFGTSGIYEATGAVRVKASTEGLVELGKPSTGVLRVSNTAGSRTARVLFPNITSNVDISFKNQSGTVALLSDIEDVAVKEAPLDGNTYGRSAGIWVPIVTGGIDPTNQNISKSGQGYKLLTLNTPNLTLGLNSFMFGSPSSFDFTSGANSVAFGLTNRPEGARSINMGTDNRTLNTAVDSGAFGIQNNVTSPASFALGQRLSTDALNQVWVGGYNLASNPTVVFGVGIGTSTSDRANAFEVLDKVNGGFARLPHADASDMFDSIDEKLIVTKEYLNAYFVPRTAYEDLLARVEALENA